MRPKRERRQAKFHARACGVTSQRAFGAPVKAEVGSAAGARRSGMRVAMPRGFAARRRSAICRVTCRQHAVALRYAAAPRGAARCVARCLPTRLPARMLKCRRPTPTACAMPHDAFTCCRQRHAIIAAAMPYARIRERACYVCALR